MRDAPLGPSFRPSDLDEPRLAEQALARWNELTSAQVEALLAHPDHGPRLEMLRRAECWLEDRSEEGAPSASDSQHPPADELYDYGRGPGAVPLAPGRRRALEDHLAGCTDCSGLMASLATPPPVPLIAGESQEASAEPGAEEPAALPGPAPRLGSLRSLRLWVPTAAAAGLVAVGLVWQSGVWGKGPAHFPEAPLLRGESSDPLLYPRGRVLPSGAEGPTTWAAEPRFVLADVPGASEYRLEVRRHEGSAFASGEAVLAIAGPGPVFALESADTDALLTPGPYTWEAWAVVDGLDRRLGSRDFQVVAQAELERALAGLDGDDPDEVLRLVQRLHEAGFTTDARQLARTLPPSPDRDAYLARRPGR